VPEAVTRTAGYLASQRIRKRIEESFAWVKEIARLRQTRHRGLVRVSAVFSLAVTAYNRTRLPSLLRAAARPDGASTKHHPQDAAARPTTRPKHALQPSDKLSSVRVLQQPANALVE